MKITIWHRKTTVYRRISVTHRERRRRRRVSRLKHIYLDLLEHKNSAMYFGSVRHIHHDACTPKNIAINFKVSYRVVRRRASSCVVVCRSDGRRITCVMRRSTLSWGYGPDARHRTSLCRRYIDVDHVQDLRECSRRDDYWYEHVRTSCEPVWTTHWVLDSVACNESTRCKRNIASYSQSYTVWRVEVSDSSHYHYNSDIGLIYVLRSIFLLT